MFVCKAVTLPLFTFFSIMNRIEASFVISSLSDFFFCLIVPLFNKESILNVPVAASLTLDGGLCSSPPAGLLLIDVLRSIIAY